MWAVKMASDESKGVCLFAYTYILGQCARHTGGPVVFWDCIASAYLELLDGDILIDMHGL
jgi:hypothetical protein